MSELVPVKDPAEIEAADPEVAAAMITRALGESRAWIAKAVEFGDPTPIAEFKAWAVLVEEATKQRKLGREIELDAAEMVRRAERGIGLAVRKGQQEGTVRRAGQRSDRPGHALPDAKSVKDYLPHGQEVHDTYAMTDNVSDEEFDEAIAEAKDEENLSRANVVRKAKGIKNGETAADRRKKIEEMAGEGYTSRQIAKKVGVGEEWVRKVARDNDIEITADKVTGKARRIDHDRILSETVTSLEGTAMALDLLDLSQVSTDDVPYFVESLSASVKALNQLLRGLKEIAK